MTAHSQRKDVNLIATAWPSPSPYEEVVPRAVVTRRFPLTTARRNRRSNSQSIAGRRKPRPEPCWIFAGRSTCSPEFGGDCVDPTLLSVDRCGPGSLRDQNTTDAAIMDKSGNTPPNIGHFP